MHNLIDFVQMEKIKKMETTRQSLLDAAQKLFGESGIKNTTMNDIAVESQKGRRTIYTYFKNKDEVLDAVVKNELQYVVSSLEEATQQKTDPLTRLLNYVITRMNVVREAVQRNGSLQAEFFRDVIKVELVRRKLEKIEIRNLEAILQDGVDQKVFDIPNIKQVAIFAHFVMRGIDVPYIRGQFHEEGKSDAEVLREKASIMLQGLLKS